MRGVNSFLLLALACLVAVTVAAPSKSTTEGRKVPDGVDDDVWAMVGDMTLQEKVGQMTQLNIDFMGGYDQQGNFWLDDAKLEKAFNQYKVGSILNSPYANGQSGLVWDVNQWRSVTGQLQAAALKYTGVPMVYGVDSVHGAVYVRYSTIFPQQINMAAAFNRTLVYKAGRVTGNETSLAGIPWAFSPILGPMMQPGWARVYETFGQDPFTAEELGVAVIRGLQGAAPEQQYDASGASKQTHFRGDGTMNDCARSEPSAGQPGDQSDAQQTELPSQSVAACMKHFVGYSNPRSGHDRSQSWISDRYLYRYFLPSFRAAVDRGQVMTAMECYISINGEAVVGSNGYLERMLRKELKFPGMLVTDYAEIENLYNWHHVVASTTEATHLSINQTSVDMSMVPSDFTFSEQLVQLVQSGMIPQARVDQSAARVVQLKKNAGLFDHPYPPTPAACPEASRASKVSKQGPTPRPVLDDLPLLLSTPESVEVSLELARQSIVLAQNVNNQWPLRFNTGPTGPQTPKVLFLGPGADSAANLVGGWSLFWQGPTSDSQLWGGFDGLDMNSPPATIAGAFAEYAKQQNLNVQSQAALGVDVYGNPASDNQEVFDTLIPAAAHIIVCISEHPYAEKPGDINDLYLPMGQLDFVNQVQRMVGTSGKTMSLIYTGGRPRLLNNVQGDIWTVLYAMLPGPMGGRAIAEIILGMTNPSGRMPLSYPSDSNTAMLPYWRPYSTVVPQGGDPIWEFGHGLSYTQFQYSELKVSPSLITKVDQPVTVTVRISNVGQMAGREVALLFVAQKSRIIAPERRMLRGFQDVWLEPGASTVLSFQLAAFPDLAFYGEFTEFRVQDGQFEISFNGGGDSQTVRLDSAEEAPEGNSGDDMADGGFNRQVIGSQVQERGTRFGDVTAALQMLVGCPGYNMRYRTVHSHCINVTMSKLPEPLPYGPQWGAKQEL